MRYQWLFAPCTALIGIVVSGHSASACPACGPVLTATLSERYAGADAAMLAQLVESRAASPEKGTPARSIFKVLQVGRAAKGGPKRGESLAVARAVSGERGDLFVLFGSKMDGMQAAADVLDWDKPLDASETAWHYIRQAPPPETPVEKRLPYFLRFFEFSDPLIADDAYAEFAKTEFKHVAAVADAFPRKKLRAWLSDPETSASRIGLYGLMLGLCGSGDDAKFLEKIVRDEKEFRLGLDGIIFGYLLLTGEEGLELIERTKLDNPKAPFNETYSAMQALRIYWTYGNGRIGKDRLKESMRLLLKQKDLRELVLADLARWKDWSLIEKLAGLYGAEGWDDRAVKMAIIQYLLAATKDAPERGATKGRPPEHVAAARRHLESLKKQDPKLVDAAMRLGF